MEKLYVSDKWVILEDTSLVFEDTCLVFGEFRDVHMNPVQKDLVGIGGDVIFMFLVHKEIIWVVRNSADKSTEACLSPSFSSMLRSSLPVLLKNICLVCLKKFFTAPFKTNWVTFFKILKHFLKLFYSDVQIKFYSLSLKEYKVLQLIRNLNLQFKNVFPRYFAHISIYSERPLCFLLSHLLLG